MGHRHAYRVLCRRGLDRVPRPYRPRGGEGLGVVHEHWRGEEPHVWRGVRLGIGPYPGAPDPARARPLTRSTSADPASEMVRGFRSERHRVTTPIGTLLRITG